MDKLEILTPVCDFKPWDSVVLDNVGYAEGRAGIADSPDHEGNTNVGENNGISLRFGEQD